MGHAKIQTNLSEREYYRSVIVLNAGGTINMSGDKERKPSDALGKAIEQVKNDMWDKFEISITFEQVFERAPDSSNIGESDWDTIINKINKVIIEKRKIAEMLRLEGIKMEKGGIVITHGTDTLAITSFVVSLVLAHFEPFLSIIFTGSHSVINVPRTDAINNLKKSIFASMERFPDEENNLPPGVYVLIGQDIHLASRLTKASTQPNSDGKYFFSFPAPVARITSTHIPKDQRQSGKKTGKDFRIKVHKNLLEYLSQINTEKKLTLPKFIMGQKINWGIVEHLIVDAKSSCDIFADFKRRVNYYRSKANFEDRNIGLVLQGNFTNNDKLSEISALLKEIAELNVVIFVGSKQVFQKLNEENHNNYLGIIHKSLSHSKAVMKLKWLLSFDLGSADVIKLMGTNIVGDIFNTEEFPEWINYETFPLAHEVVIIYPDYHSKMLKDACQRLQKNNDPNKKLILYGFGDGHIPTTNKSIPEIVIDFLEKEGLSTYKQVEIDLEDSLETFRQKLAKHFNKKDKRKLKDYLEMNYDISKRDLLANLKKVLEEELIKKSLDKLEKQLTNVVENYSTKNSNILSATNTSDCIASAVKVMNIFIKKAAINECLSKKGIDENKLEANYMIELLVDESFIDLVIKRLMKDALINADIRLKEIAIAIDEGISVEIKTSAVMSKTNTTLYENGNKLMILGVHSDETDGWDTSYLKRKNLLKKTPD